MLPDNLARLAIATARANGIDPAAFLAVCEVEAPRGPFESDGRTPTTLFERHVCWREAGKRGLLPAFRSAGLAIPKWNKATQYADQRTSAQRIALQRRARAIDEEVALRSASHGMAQIMGNHAETLGFDSAAALVRTMSQSAEAQLDCMVRELKTTHLVASLNAHDWTHFARVWNGPGFRANRYDEKLADAHKRWCRGLVTLEARAASPEDALSAHDVMAVQEKLRALGYAEVGKPDGRWGTRTTGAIAAFQRHEGLPVTGHFDVATRAALDVAEARSVAPERESVTAGELKASGSRTIAQADSVSLWGRLKAWLGLALGGGVAAEQGGLLGSAQDAVEKAQQAKSIWSSLRDLVAPVLGSPVTLIVVAILVVGGLAIVHAAERVRQARVDDERSGVHA